LDADAPNINPGFELKLIAIVISIVRLRPFNNDAKSKSFKSFLHFFSKIY